MYNEVRRDDDHLDDQEYHYPPCNKRVCNKNSEPLYIRLSKVSQSFDYEHSCPLSHYTFIGKINEKLNFWKEAWAHHRIRTALWVSGQYERIVGT
jgi:hypothetical protein